MGDMGDIAGTDIFVGGMMSLGQFKEIELIDFWNEILVPKFLRYKHILVDRRGHIRSDSCAA